MEGDHIHINYWLEPLSWLYGFGVWLRNRCFEAGLFKEISYDLPVICVGNLTVGGTGKTPHTEYLLDLLLPHFRTAVLSRGYKRKSCGFQLAEEETPMSRIGDESWQMKHKFPDAIIAVDSNRRRGISLLMASKETRPEVILLDDAFQHRYVKAGLNILLTDYHRIISDDKLFPAGRLREPFSGRLRAQVVVVTKCPRDLTPMEIRVIKKALNLQPHQRLYFTTLRYGKLANLYDSGAEECVLDAETHVLLLTGIATPQQMLQDLQVHTKHIKPMTFADHHAFSGKDVRNIEAAFNEMQGSKRMIITTEKDAARLLEAEGFSTVFKRHLYVLPVEVEFLLQQGRDFNQLITDFVER